MFSFLACYKYVVFIFAFFPRTVSERGNAVSILFVRRPLSLIPKAVTALADTEPSAFIVFPFSHISFCDTRVQMFILDNETCV